MAFSALMLMLHCHGPWRVSENGERDFPAKLVDLEPGDDGLGEYTLIRGPGLMTQYPSLGLRGSVRMGDSCGRETSSCQICWGEMRCPSVYGVAPSALQQWMSLMALKSVCLAEPHLDSTAVNETSS